MKKFFKIFTLISLLIFSLSFTTQTADAQYDINDFYTPSPTPTHSPSPSPTGNTLSSAASEAKTGPKELVLVSLLAGLLIVVLRKTLARKLLD